MDPMAMGNLDAVWEIQEMRKTARAKELYDSFEPLRDDLVYLANARLHQHRR